jgi:hypothetical protein
VFHRPPNCFSATVENAPGESSRTWRTPAYDVADRIPARSDPARPCRPARCKERSAHPDEVPLRRADDSRYPEYALPETSAHARASACRVRACSVAGGWRRPKFGGVPSRFQHGGSPDRVASRAMAWDRNRSNVRRASEDEVQDESQRGIPAVTHRSVTRRRLTDPGRRSPKSSRFQV